LAETAEKVSEIDIERAEAALKDATSKLDSLEVGSAEHGEEQARIRRANVRLKGAKLASH
jgi:F0F1-type ATP synthase epsilon subunit